jgi:hypothetical protein
MARLTTYADRKQLVDFHEQGHSYRDIAQTTGWSRETVRKICRQVRKLGPAALLPQRAGRPKSGPLSTFDVRVKFAALKIKRRHPDWGPDVIVAELAKRPWAQGKPLPSASSLGAYFHPFGKRLLAPRARRRLSQAEPQGPSPPEVHACWQVDVDEQVCLPGYGRAHVLNIYDHFSGIKIASLLFPAQRNGKACRLTWRQFQWALRQAFHKWGLPDRVRTDRDRALVARDPSPFPLAFTLWLAGLGIEHELIRRVTQNGGVERSHRTWVARLKGYGPFAALPTWQALVDYELWRMNAVLPSRGRHCQRRPPLLVYPQARIPRRGYRAADELAMFAEHRLHAYLAEGEWLRKTSDKGQFRIGNQRFNLGVGHKDQWMKIVFQPKVGFQAVCPESAAVLKVFQLKGLSPAELTGLEGGV